MSSAVATGVVTETTPAAAANAAATPVSAAEAASADSAPAKAQLLLMARYHKWATAKLLTALADLPASDLQRPLGLPFRSVHATLNHLLLADALWMSRHTGRASVAGIDTAACGFMWAGETDDGHWDAIPGLERVTTTGGVGALMLRLCDDWIALVEGLTDDQLGTSFEYHSTGGAPLRKQRAGALQHLFNHGTHHRGQVTVAFSLLGRKGPALDLLYFLDPAS